MESEHDAIDGPLTELLTTSMPFAAGLGIAVLRGSPDELVARIAWAPDRCTTAELLHGGYLMAVADSLGAVCAFLNLPPDAATSTIESKTNFIRGVTAGELTVTTTPVHVGRTTIVVQTDITRPDGKLVTRTTQTQAVLPSR